MPRKVKKKGWLYGTWVHPSGDRLECEMPASKFIGIIYGALDEAGRAEVMAELVAAKIRSEPT